MLNLTKDGEWGGGDSRERYIFAVWFSTATIYNSLFDSDILAHIVSANLPLGLQYHSPL